jgi:hypothetical protein
MIADIPSEQIEVICKYAVVGLLWFLSVVITAWVGFRYGLRSQENAALLEDKLKIIPLIDGFLLGASSYPVPNQVRTECIAGLWDLHFRFRVHLKDKKRCLRRFDAAWDKLEQTTEAEMIGKSGQAFFDENQVEDFKRVSQILISRLRALRDCIERA